MSGMRAGNREINIINMSLLDILCGAMGAFCFMMLALFPYWSPTGVGAKDAAAKSEQMQRELEELKEQLRRSGGAAAADALERLEKLQKQIQQLEGENNRLRKDLEDEKKYSSRMEMRNATVVTATWTTAAHDIDIMIHMPGLKTTGGKIQPLPNPAVKEGHFFGGDYSYGMSRGPGFDLWLMRDTVAGSRCDVYYKFLANNGNPEPARVSGHVIHDSTLSLLPAVVMPQERTVKKVGTLIVNPNYSLRFEPVPELAESYRQQLAAARQSQPGTK